MIPIYPQRPHPLRPKTWRDIDERLRRQYANYLKIQDQRLADRFNEHVESWFQCDACSLCKSRRHVVLFRGTLPCQVLFIGEAPGDSEDSLGYPFIGPAGSLFDCLLSDTIIQCSLIGTTEQQRPSGFRIPTWGITNIIACHPTKKQELSSPTTRPPNKQEAEACSPRLGEIIVMAAPRLVVTLGDTAKRFINITMPVPQPEGGPRVIHLLHPAAILHMTHEQASQQQIAEKRWVITLSEALQCL